MSLHVCCILMKNQFLVINFYFRFWQLFPNQYVAKLFVILFLLSYFEKPFCTWTLAFYSKRTFLWINAYHFRFWKFSKIIACILLQNKAYLYDLGFVPTLIRSSCPTHVNLVKMISTRFVGQFADVFWLTLEQSLYCYPDPDIYLETLACILLKKTLFSILDLDFISPNGDIIT